MSKFHSTISRRTFMKGIGLAGAGLGDAAAAAPVFHDLDEVTASPNSVRKLPWYVKEREFFDLTVEIDWAGKERFDKRNSYSYPDVAVGEEQTPQYWREFRADLAAEGVRNNKPGDTLKDQAIVGAADIMMSSTLTGPDQEEIFYGTHGA